jgi:hypothetical protein
MRGVVGGPGRAGRIVSVPAAVLLTAGLLVGCASNSPSPDASEDAAVSLSPEQQSRLVVAEGECYVDDPTADSAESGLVDCAEAHDFEIYYSETLPDGDFPGASEVRDSADVVCAKELPGFLGASSEELGLEFFSITPTATMWDADGDRAISCAVRDPEGPVTGSLQGSGS